MGSLCLVPTRAPADEPTGDFETQFPCVAGLRKLEQDARALAESKVRRAARKGSEPPMPIATVPLTELSKKGSRQPASTSDMLLQAVPVPVLPPPDAVVETGVPSALRELWREAHAMPSTKSAELEALADRATREVTLCRGTECPDRDCMIAFVEAVRNREGVLRAELVPALWRALEQGRSAGTVLALLHEQPEGPKTDRVLVDQLVTLTRKDERLGEYARYRSAASLETGERLQKLRALEPVTDARTAFLTRFAMANLSESSAERKVLLRSALDVLPVDDGPSARAREDAQRFLLRVHADRAEHSERLALAAVLLSTGVSAETRADALDHAADALRFAPKLGSASAVTVATFVQLANHVAERALEDQELALARHAWLAAARHAPDPSSRRAAESDLGRLATMEPDEPALETMSEFVDRWFLVVGTHSTFAAAKEAMLVLQGRLGLELGRTDVESDGHGGVTFPSAICAAESGSYPCYFPRGRFDDGAYLSIESSSAYDGFTQGLFLVIAASGARGSPEISQVWDKSKRIGVPAYLRKSSVYMGCMH